MYARAMSLWFRIIGILSAGVAAYFYHYEDDQLMAIIFAAIASFSLSLSWVFHATR